MKKDRLDASEKRFWDGKSDLNEERLLKTHSEDPYFDVVRQTAQESMDWDFQDFMQKVGAEPEKAKVVKVDFRFRKLWWAAAVVAVAIGIVWITNPTKNANHPIQTENNIAHTSNRDSVTKVGNNTQLATTNKPIQTTNKTVAAKVASHTLGKRHRKVAAPASAATVVPETDTSGVYEPQFVFINGKPVYDEDEAVKITKQSLALLADNVDKSARPLAMVQKLSIHL